MTDKQNPGSKKYIWICSIYFSFLIVGIPWYWPKDSSLVVMGLPAWVFVSISISLLTSIFTAYLLLRYPWQTEVNVDE